MTLRCENTIDEKLKEVRLSLSKFTKFTKPDYQSTWFHDAICDKLELFAAGRIKKLMINVPPQHGKSELSSRRFPAWVLGLDPNKRMAIASYGASHAQAFNRDVQRIIMSDAYSLLFPSTTLNTKNVATTSQGSYRRTANVFDVVLASGFLKTIGRGGALTGTTLDIGILDDLYKDRAEASSQVIRNSAWEFYTDVFETRLHNDSQQLILNTRWHEDDLNGRVLDRDGLVEEGGEWDLVVFPALKEDHSNPYDPREIGEALWPEKHSRERMEKIRDASPTTFASLYQQRPAPVEGGMIKKGWFGRYNENEIDWSKVTTHFYLDTAYTDKQQNDPTAILAFAKINGRLYLRHCKVVRMEFPELVAFIPRYVGIYGNQKSGVIIEPKASGLSVIQTLRRETRLNIIQDVPPRDSKVTRVASVTPILESGRVLLPEVGSWVGAFLAECTVFPNGLHDDQVDALVGAINKALASKNGSQNFESGVV